ncbi:UDP-3-O-acyl-N-acetylglucosamine deacetylase [Blattabacterium cuenoti]|uniref:UDP-3-O-acyl-N-acetylglucosamine deacetylase n=1 Tax=Blattabacterium cuenoti TaxID=1653831 RepID=UPI00312018FB
MLEKQKTIEKKIFLQGFGLLYTTKKKGSITFKPAPIHTGFIVIRTNIKEKSCIKTHYSFLDNKGKHILAVRSKRYGFINVIVKLEHGNSYSIMYDYSKFFVEEIQRVGIIEQSEKRKYSYAQSAILKHIDSFHKKIEVPKNFFSFTKEYKRFWKIKEDSMSSLEDFILFRNNQALNEI